MKAEKVLCLYMIMNVLQIANSKKKTIFLLLKNKKHIHI